MKALFYTKTLIALAVAVAAAAAAVSQAQEAPIPPPSADSALPANIAPGTPLADVVKMVQAGVDASTIRSYIDNSQNAFNLDADKILYLKDLGLPSDLVNAMMDRDKFLYASSVTPPPATTTVASSVPDTAPPQTDVTVNYFYDTLSPYGAWVDVDGYGRCWRPTVVVYDTSWRPYCDRGHWVYTDCGWYWDSDYAWGVAFHYGRWFHHARFGWCWYPDTVWGPSWVAWRSGGDYCGWAPLPPYAEFRAGFGFYYRGASVAMDFDFGLGVDAFLFVSSDHFCDWHPRSFCFDRPRSVQVFNQTTIVNNYIANNQVIINRGISVDRISGAMHRPLTPVQVSSLPNSARQGWHGGGGVNSGSANLHGSQFGHGAGISGNNNNPGIHTASGKIPVDPKPDHGNTSFHSDINRSTSGFKPESGSIGSIDRSKDVVNSHSGQPFSAGTGGVGKTSVAGGTPPIVNHQYGSSHAMAPQGLKPANNYDQFSYSRPTHNEGLGMAEKPLAPAQQAPIVAGRGSAVSGEGNAWDHRPAGNSWSSDNHVTRPAPITPQESPSYQPKQYHSYSGVDAGSSHGATQLQQPTQPHFAMPEQPHFTMPEQPRMETRPSYSPPPAQSYGSAPAFSSPAHNPAPAPSAPAPTPAPAVSSSKAGGGSSSSSYNNSGGSDKGNHQNH
ncbi:MAG TPA: DUF6600 domain-containing protein [Verrucomicrobiae bacterium]